jgi:translation initiation factor IF-1
MKGKKKNKNIRISELGDTLLIAAKDTGLRRGGIILRGRQSETRRE